MIAAYGSLRRGAEGGNGMADRAVRVFFYGLFMDRDLLVQKGLQPGEAAVGFVEGLALRIGRRATLTGQPGRRAHGVVMTLRETEAAALYAEESVADYRPEPVRVILGDGSAVEAVCYMLPDGPDAGTNTDYAAALLALAVRLNLPAPYREEISRLAR